MPAATLIQEFPGVRTRRLQSDDDFWRMRRLLIETTPITPVGFNWDIRHLDGQRFHDRANSQSSSAASLLQLWEDSEGRLVGFRAQRSRGRNAVSCASRLPLSRRRNVGLVRAELGNHSRKAGVNWPRYVFEYDVWRQQLLTNAGLREVALWRRHAPFAHR